MMWHAARPCKRKPSELNSTIIVVSILALRSLFPLHGRILNYVVRCSQRALASGETYYPRLAVQVSPSAVFAPSALPPEAPTRLRYIFK
jgi:hypothetical protein